MTLSVQRGDSGASSAKIGNRFAATNDSLDTEQFAYYSPSMSLLLLMYCNYIRKKSILQVFFLIFL